MVLSGMGSVVCASEANVHLVLVSVCQPDGMVEMPFVCG
jgi:hypothetical protein